MYFFVQIARVLYILLRDISFLKRVLTEAFSPAFLGTGFLRGSKSDPGWIYIRVCKDQVLAMDTTNAQDSNGRRKPLGLVLLDNADLGPSVFVYHDISGNRTEVFSASADVPSTVFGALRPMSATSGETSTCILSAPKMEGPEMLMESGLYRFLAVMAWTHRKAMESEAPPVLTVGHVHSFLRRIVASRFFQNACNNFFPKLFQMAAAESSTYQERGMLFSAVSFIDILGNSDLNDFIMLMDKSRYMSNCGYFHTALTTQTFATINALNCHLDQAQKAFREFKI